MEPEGTAWERYQARTRAASQRYRDKLKDEGRKAKSGPSGKNKSPRNWQAPSRTQNPARQERRRERDLERAVSRWTGREFCAVDGEGWDLGPRQHVLTMFGSSHAPTLYRKEGLSTEELLEYLLHLGEPGRVLVGFRFGYDVNMILADLNKPAIDALCAEQWASFWPKAGGPDYYRIRYTPNKSLYITFGHYSQASGSWEWVRQGSVVVWDVFGFFQCSFLKACQSWGVGTEEELAAIRAGKGARRSFKDTDRESIQHYNELECDLLVRLMGEVRQALTELDIRLPRWDGAGAIANALHEKYNTKSHKPTGTDEPEEVMRAFYGARVQRLRCGDHLQVWGHDINSAYPSTIRNLPSLAGGRWERVSTYNPSADCAIWDVSWDVGGEHDNPRYPLTPFPWRSKSYGILYPQAGRGIYWASLVAVAMAAWPGRITVNGGWVFHPASDEKPFAWVNALYDLRREKKAAGLGGQEKILKLGYNSLYGKFSQGVGYFQGRAPAYQNFTWAGMTTAHCQARVLAAACQAPNGIIAIATDGVFSRQKLRVPDGKELGEWEVSYYDRMFLLQPGVYALWEGEQVRLKTRGFSPDDLPLDTALEQWQAEGQSMLLKIEPTRFIGMHLARAWNRLDNDWRQWLPVPRQLGVMSGNSIPDITAPWEPSLQCHPLVLPPELIGQLPEPYVPRGQINLDPEERLEEVLAADQG